jgi:hypothetical protein
MAEQSTPRESPGFGEPYCSNCSYPLGGLVDSSKCPECGRPLVEVLVRAGRMGRRYRSSTMMWGLPLIDIAMGPAPGEPIGRACGVIAIGDRATGLIAIGGLARGVVAIGGLSMGLFAIGGLSLGLISALGGLAAGLFVHGGLVLGGLAAGGMAIGFVAVGGMALGVYVHGGLKIGPFILGSGPGAAIEPYVSWFTGAPGSAFMGMQPMIATITMTVLAAGVIGLLALLRHWRAERGPGPPAWPR